MKKIYIALFALSFSLIGKAQNLNTHYLYQLNWFNINPAYTGETEGVKAMINPGTQWTGMDGSPTNSMLGFHTAIGDKMGIGSKIVIDKRGIFSNFTGEIAYSYKVKLSDKQRLSFGVTGGIYQTNINKNDIINDKYTDATDPTVNSNFYNSVNFLASFGALYQFKGLELGVSAPHLVVSGQPISDHLFGTAKYNFKLMDDKLTLSPLAIYQSLSTSPDIMDFGVKGIWAKTVWAQLTYRTNKNIVMAAGFNINKINLGYAFSLSQDPMSVISKGSHEVYIGFTFDKLKHKKKSSSNNLSNNEPNKLQSILKDLISINDKNDISEEEKAEIISIQTELSGLVKKLKKGNLSAEDQQKMNQLENRIKDLKSKYSN